MFFRHILGLKGIPSFNVDNSCVHMHVNERKCSWVRINVKQNLQAWEAASSDFLTHQSRELFSAQDIKISAGTSVINFDLTLTPFGNDVIQFNVLLSLVSI